MIRFLLSEDNAWVVLAIAVFVLIILPAGLVCYAVVRNRHPDPYSQRGDWGDQ